MGRAIVRNPQVFLFDEPLSNLDAKLRVVMRGEIKSLHQRLGVTTLYVTHDQIEAMTMADKIVVMNAGKVEQIGVPLDLYDRPANLFVAGFIGSPSMNFISGQITPDGFTAAGITLPLPPGLAPGKATYGIRPEHFELSPAGVAATVLLVEPMGSETQVTMMLGEHQVIGVFRERVKARPGETIMVRPDPASVHLFDATTGARIN
jgi:multiple sugar transport system ATP-binding protein